MTMKDNLLKMLTQGLVYRKVILWMDMSIPPDEFIRDSVIQKINDLIANMKSTKNYIPTKMMFEELEIENLGVYNLGEDDRMFNIEDTAFGSLKIFADQFVEMESLIK